MEKRKQVSLILPDWQKAALDKIYNDVGIRQSEVVRRAIAMYLARVYGVSELNEPVGDK